MQVELKLRYINNWVDHLGRQRYRFRRRGFPRIELPVDSDPSSPEFMAAYFAALKGEKVGDAVAAVTARGGSGTVGNAIERYLDSTSFRDGSEESTQALRRPILKSFLKPGIGNLPLAKVDRRYLERWLETAPTRGVKRTWLLAVKPFFQWAVGSVHLIEVNPCEGIKVMIVEGDGHSTWEPEQIEQYRAHHALGTRARLAFELLLTVTARRSDALALGKQHLKNGGKWLSFVQRKNRRRKPSKVDMPMPPELAAAIEACPAPAESLTFLVNERGRPYTEKNFNTHFRKWCNAAGLPKDCVPHGVRKAGCKLLADSGCTTSEVMAISGHRTSKEVDRYTRAFDRKQAAMRAQAKVAAAKDSNVVPMPIANR